MIKLLLFMAFISSAFSREKDPWGFITETIIPVPELYAAKNDFDRLMFLSKRMKAIVEGPYVEIQSIYTYKNIMAHLVATEFEFPQIETDISHRVEIRYQDTSRIIFDEANSPKKDYNKENPYTKERFSYKEIQAGNVRAQDTVEVIFSVMRPLKVKFNQFYELSISPHHESRFATLNSMLVKGNYNIQVELKSEKPFTILANPTHHLKPELSNHADFYKAFYNVTMENIYSFSGDFKIYFASEDFNTPQTIMATHSFNPHSHAFMFSLIPDMKYFPSSGWDQSFRKEAKPIIQRLSDPDNFFKLKKMTVQSDLLYFGNEYLFVIDQSDSMRGSRLENLKNTLNNFLGTLSRRASVYSILSFGSTLKLSGNKTEEKSAKLPQDTEQIMKWVETLEADMGKKDLLSALKYAFEEYEWTNLPKNVIILTDNEISNVEEIIQLVQTNSNSQKICAIGVEGDGDVIRKIAEAGKCQTEFIHWWEDFDERTLNVLDATLKSPGFNLAYEITCVNDQNQVVHQEEGGSEGISKDKTFIKWVTLHSIPNLNSCKAKIFYYSQHRCSSYSQEIEIFRSQSAQLTDIWHKVAHHAELHDNLQIEVSNMPETPEDGIDVIDSFESQEISQEELILNDKPRSLFDIYQEQFRNLQCYDPKRPLLTGIALSKSFFEEAQDEDEDKSILLGPGGFEKENISSRQEEHQEEEGFSSFNIGCIASVFTLLFVAALFIIL